ncbi:hypothetical protein IP510_13580, partial [Psychrobacter sp. NG254]|uniref:Ig-like domain-containing protein n=1 Tax=Psychrobacter sp. NG254 TaxID=2782003 RepID=UPI0019F101F3
EIQTGTLGQPVVIDVLSNDTDLEGDIDPTTVKLINPDTGLEVTSLTVAGEGAWSVDPTTGAVTFTPEAGFTNDPTPVNYVVSDVTGNKSNQATITIDYPQSAPVAVNDTKSGASGATVDVAVVGNDTDLEGDIDPTSVLITQAPVGSTIAADGKSVVVDGEGSWSVDPVSGNITFTPEDGFTGDPTPISYTVDDITGETSNPATVTIDYPQTAPVAKNDRGVGPLNTPVAVNILANDTDPENDLDPTTVMITQSPAGGTIAADGKSVDVPGEGSWVVDPTTGVVTFTPEAGFTADPTPISYTVDDITGETSNEAIIIVDYPPTAPVAVDDTNTGTTGNPVVVDILSNDTDLDGDLDPTTVKLIDPTDGSEVTALTVEGEGEWVVNPTTGAVTFTPEAGFTGDPTPVEYVVSDTTGLTSEPATVTIDYPQTAPVAVNDTDTGTTGNPVTVAVVGNDTDPENDIDPTSVLITVSPAGGTIAADGKSVDVAGEGSWSVDPVSGDITFTPEEGFTGDPTPISYTVNDTTGLTSNPATVTIDYPQSAPVAVNDNESGTSGSPVVVAVVGNDTDPENDIDPTSVLITVSPAGSTIAADGKSVVVDGEGSWSVDPVSGNITFTPEDGFTGDPTPISYTVDDITGETSNPATVTIDYPQTAPVAKNDRGVGPLNTPVAVNILANDTDPENDLDPTTVMITQSPAGGTIAADGKSVDVPGEGSWVVDPTTGVVTFTPEAGFTADPTPISYTVDDITGETSNEAIIIVDYPPTAPVAVDDTNTGTTGNPVVVDILSNDTDLDGDLDPTTVKLIDPTDGSEVTALTVEGEGEWVVNPTTGAVTFTPEAGFTGDPTPVEYVVSDTTGLTSEPATVTIDYPQTAPVAVNDTDTGTTGNPVTVAVVGNDTDPENDIDPASVIITVSPAGGTIAADGKSVVVDGEGTWTVNPATGNIS